MKTDSGVKSDTNQLQNSLKSDTCPAGLPLSKIQQLCPACLVLLCQFLTTQQVSVSGLSQSAVGFFIIVLSIVGVFDASPSGLNRSLSNTVRHRISWWRSLIRNCILEFQWGLVPENKLTLSCPAYPSTLFRPAV